MTRSPDGPKAKPLLRFDSVHSWRTRSPLSEEYALAAMLDAVIYANLNPGYPTQRMNQSVAWAADTLTRAIPVPERARDTKNWPKVALDRWVRWELKRIVKRKGAA